MTTDIRPRRYLKTFFGLALALAPLAASQLGWAQSAVVDPDMYEARQAVKADTVFLNGEIKTATGWTSALAVREGVIVALGQDVDAFTGPDTQVIDLAGKTMLPGLYDMHVHAQFAGMEKLFSCSLPSSAGLGAVTEIVRNCVARSNAGDWIEGGNWVAGAFAQGEMHRKYLDDVSPDNPVVLNDEAHHSIWVNSAALKQAGIGRDTPEVSGGVIERDENGEPTGVFRETAVDLVIRHMPPPSLEAKRQAIEYASQTMLSYGITSFTNASTRYGDIQALSDLAASGAIKQRVRGCIVWNPAPEFSRTATEALIRDRFHYAKGRLKLDCVKMFLDGVPTESHTGAMLEPYVRASHDEAATKGILFVPSDMLRDVVTRFDREGLHVKFHATGDAAVRAAIEVVAHARQENGDGGPAHTVAHASFVAPEDFAKAKQAGVTWEFSPYIWYPTPITADVAKAVGWGRMDRFVPIRDALMSGANVIAGSDWSVVPSVNPWLAIETMVTRRTPGTGEPLNTGQAISIEEAMKIMTQNGARAMGDADEVGILDLGMKADMILVGQNPYKVQSNRIHETTTLQVYIDGSKVFERND
ncbi:amidohydrolase [Kordiimonas lipolytica]|uniref:Amidohydrolase n=1 Tax=Kordiimonas lipolytica TaxID=1662421 RepID=A0ABV8U9V8_9PROT|nr:amidohydrolase [Kordiimonas lipolytica]